VSGQRTLSIEINVIVFEEIQVHYIASQYHIWSEVSVARRKLTIRNVTSWISGIVLDRNVITDSCLFVEALLITMDVVVF